MSKPNDPLEEKMSMLLGQVPHLTTQMQTTYQGGGGTDNGGFYGAKFKFQKCDDCERDGKFCRHCWKCKKEGHKQAECPEN